VELVGVFRPAVADVGAVIHVGDEDVFDAAVDLGLRLFHRLARANHRKHDSGCTGNEPLPVHLFHVFDVDLLGRAALENDGAIFRERFERRFVAKR